jgi:hypothetical protein
MDIDEKSLTAYCGLYCGDCIRYRSRASDLAKELADELEMIKFNEYAKVKSSSVHALKGYEQFLSTLEGIFSIKCNTPCRLGGDGCAEPCEIIECVLSNNLDGCWEYDNLQECDRFDFLKDFHGNAPLENCRKIKKQGIHHWSDHRSKCYPWL